MVVRDATGRVVRRSDLRPYFSDFSLCRWPTKEGGIHALLAEDDVV